MAEQPATRYAGPLADLAERRAVVADLLDRVDGGLDERADGLGAALFLRAPGRGGRAHPDVGAVRLPARRNLPVRTVPSDGAATPLPKTYSPLTRTALTAASLR